MFPVWTAMQLTWLSTSYHDHSSLSCPLISWGSVKTETLPALCNKNNKPIDLIHLRCGWQLTLLRERKDWPTPDPAQTIRFMIWNHTISLQTIQFSDQTIQFQVSQENAPHQILCLTENVSFPNMHTLQTQTGPEIVTLKCLKKKANAIVCLKNISSKNGFVTRGQFWPSGIVVGCVCLSVCGKHLLVRAITCHAFKLESPNLDHKSKTPWLRSLLFWGVIDLELQGQI